MRLAVHPQTHRHVSMMKSESIQSSILMCIVVDFIYVLVVVYIILGDPIQKSFFFVVVNFLNLLLFVLAAKN